ncbi:MAG: ABC transporter substrate-binding protein [Parvimonas sp.]|uniref:ABC transporter substrate-binding protein n=1 Tax=Parvimonas sp. TaxID=1944660 RepID=UPI001CB29E5E|nr:ABC transporter substrate-binding protein [Parvimonas sp.]MBF1295406.1 ABC transporter substrate-binding protein [Parvimonas sp.]
MKKRLIFLSTIMFLVLSISLSACSGKKTEEKNSNVTEKSNQKGGTMTLAIGSDPTIVNPLYANDRVSLTISHVLYDPLYTVKNGKVVCDKLAESFTHSDDYLTYTLKFKKNIKWHDGKPLTAEDMMYTLSVILDEKQNAKGRGALVSGNEKVEFKKIDDYTIEFKLPKVNMSFVQNLAEIKPIPKHIYEGQENLEKSPNNSTPVGNGYFKFKEQKTGETYQVVRNDDYYGDVALLDSIVYRVIPDANATSVALESGEISAGYVKTNQVEKYKKNDNLNLVTFSEGMVNNIFFRVNNERIKDIRVRQAIAYAIDKEKLLKGSYGGTEYASIAHSPFSQETQYYTDDVEKYSYNIEKAKELLKEANVQNLTIRLMYTSGNPAQEKEGLLIQEMLKQINVNVELLPLERGSFIKKLLDKNNKDFEIALNGYVLGDNPDGYKAVFTSGSSENFSGYSNKKIDELFSLAVQEKDDKKREEMYKEIQQILTKDVVQISTAYVKSIVAVNKKFKNLDDAVPATIHMFDNFNKISMEK